MKTYDHKKAASIRHAWKYDEGHFGYLEFTRVCSRCGLTSIKTKGQLPIWQTFDGVVLTSGKVPPCDGSSAPKDLPS